MAVPFFLCGIGILFAMCAACFYRMSAADWADERKFLIDLLESLESENAKLREAFAAALIRVSAANEETGHYMDEDFCDMLRELGIEVDDA